jgi:MFS transporter, NRE family, putaive nickel resistance protein
VSDSTAGLTQNRNWLLLFSAQVTSLVGSGVTSVALAVFAYQLSGSNATVVVGTALMLRILAFLLFSQPAGILADRSDRKRILIAADVVRVALLCAFPFLTQVWHIYLLIFLINAATAFFTPTFEATIPGVVRDDQYTRALSMSRVSIDLEAALGPLVAGALIVWVGVRWAFWFDSLTYIVSALLLVRVRFPAIAAATPAAQAENRRMITELTFGSRIILREPALRQALVLHVAEAIAGAVAIVTTVVYVRDVLGRGEGSFALAMAGLGAGSSLAALLLARRAPSLPQGNASGHEARHRYARHMLLLGGCMLSLALLPGLARPGIALLLVLWALNGAGQALIAISSVSLLAEHTTDSERGRAYAAHFAWTHLFWLASYPGVGWLAKALGTMRTFSIAGVLCLILVAIASRMNRTHRTHPLAS